MVLYIEHLSRGLVVDSMPLSCLGKDDAAR